jgi:hypothetical protein
MKDLIIKLLVLSLISWSCSDDKPKEEQNLTERILIENSQNLDRVRLVNNQEVELKEYASESLYRTKSQALEYNFKLVKVAEVAAPILEGVQLQATHVKVAGDQAYVSYNIKGNEYGGGVDVFDISVIDTPKIVSQMLLKNTDINALDYNNGVLYLAEAVNMESVTPIYLTSPAALEVFNITNGQLSSDKSMMLDLSSYAATSVLKSQNEIYVTTGDNGAFHIVNMGTQLVESKKIDLPDLRSVAQYSEKQIILQGNPAAVKVFSTSNILENTYNLQKNLVAESKTQIAIKQNYAYVPTNADGLKILDLTNGSVVKEFPKPPTPNGADHSDYVTNAVTIFEDLVLIANGGAGLYCGQIGDNDIPEIKAIADLDASANYVDAKRNSNGNIVIFVATGTGGLKIFEYEKILALPGDTSLNYLSQYNEKGSPVDKENVPPSSDVFDNFKKVLSTGWLEKYKPELFDTVSQYITTNKLTKVWVTFLSEGGDFDNTLGFYSFNLNNPPQSPEEIGKRTVIFPNTDLERQGGGLNPGDRVYLGEFPANTGIGFFLYTDAWNSKTMKIDMDKKRWSIYSNYSFNLGKYVQHFFLFDSEKNRYFLTFEDLYYDWDEYKDHDYDDVVFMIETDNEGLNKTVFIDMAQYIK